jgi:hypothetical protein
MQTVDWLFWAIAFFFYLPLHIGAPLMFLLMRGEVEAMKAQRGAIILHGVISAILAFALAMFLWPINAFAAAAVLLAAILVPWLAVKKR